MQSSFHRRCREHEDTIPWLEEIVGRCYDLVGLGFLKIETWSMHTYLWERTRRGRTLRCGQLRDLCAGAVRWLGGARVCQQTAPNGHGEKASFLARSGDSASECETLLG